MSERALVKPEGKVRPEVWLMKDYGSTVAAEAFLPGAAGGI